MSQEIVIVLYESEASDPSAFDIVKVFKDIGGRAELFGKGPLKRVVPEPGRDSAKGLFDHGR